MKNELNLKASTKNTPDFQPVKPGERIDLLDALRGFALLGILLINIYSFAGLGTLEEEDLRQLPTYPVDRILSYLIPVLIETKFITMFSILFGIGFGIQIQRARYKKMDFRRYFLRRMGWLFVIGCLHAYLLWFGDILRFYALVGMVLLVAAGWREKIILRTGLLFAVFLTAAVFILNEFLPLEYAYLQDGIPFREKIKAAFGAGAYLEAMRFNWTIDPLHNFLMDSPLTLVTTFGKFLIGFWLVRIGFFRNLSSFKSLINKWFWYGLGFGFPASAAFILVGRGIIPLDSLWMLWLPFALAAGLLLHTFFYLSAFIKLYQGGSTARLMAHFSCVGRMALTNYILQTLIGLWLFYGFMPGPGLFGQLGHTLLLVLSLLIFILQIAFSRWWLRRFPFGPLEWLWRKLAYPSNSL